MGKIRKKTSKREPLKRRYKIEKKVRDHKKKLRKEIKKKKALGIAPKRLKKDLGIPNLYPYKEQLINALERKERLSEDEKQRLKELKRKQKKERKLLQKQDASNPMDMEEYIEEVQAKSVRYQADEQAKEEWTSDEEEPVAQRRKDQSRKAFARDLKQVVEQADVVLEVLDARDPQGSRNRELEIAMQGQGKRVVLVLNKIDLVPPENARAWLKTLRSELPCVLFKASMQKQNENLAAHIALHKNSLTQRKEMVETMLQSPKGIGSDNLMQVLKNYCRNEGGGERKLTVGVVGYPNVGKSSVINSLKRERVVKTANTPGSTRSVQEVHLDNDIVLIDCPGVVLSKGDTTSALVLKNAVNVEKIEDPVGALAGLVEKVDKQALLAVYGIQDFSGVEGFIGSVGRKRGKLTKGGVANSEDVARMVLRDWSHGKIPYFTPVPQFTSELDKMGD